MATFMRAVVALGLLLILPNVARAQGATEAEEVKVHGKRREIGRTTMSAREVREMPGAFGDSFRAIEALPGVTPVVSGLAYFFIRGAPPNNNGYYLDGIRVPQLFHLALGPGVVHPGLLDRVELYPGAAPASYGRSAGAVIAGHTREPSSTFRGEANLRLVDTGALVEAPFADDRGNALVAGRFGYPGPIVGLFSDVSLGYWDYQTRASWKLGERDTIGLFAFGSHDYLAHREDDGTLVEDLEMGFHRVEVRYDRSIEGGRIRVAGTVGYDSQGSGMSGGIAPTRLTDTSGAVRFEIERRYSPDLRMRAGGDARIDAYGFEQAPLTERRSGVVPSSANPPPTNVTTGLHADVVWRLAPRVEVVPGARVDLYSSSRDGIFGSGSATVPAFDPRLSTRVTLARSVAWLSTVGLSHQYPALRVGAIPAALVTGSGFPLGTRRLQTIAQASQGIELGLPGELTVTATGFLSGWTGLTDLTHNCVQIEPPTMPPFDPNLPQPPPEPPPYVCPNNRPVHGRSYGVELLVRRSISKRLSGWLSYTLSRSEREAHFVTFQGTEAVASVPSEFDRTHVLNVILGYDLGRRWRAGGRFVFYTGQPYSALAGTVPVPPYNDRRDAPFYRVDVRLEKRWPFGKTGSIAFVLEGQNVTLSKETTGLDTDCYGNVGPAGGTLECKRASIGPITIPSIGVEAFF